MGRNNLPVRNLRKTLPPFSSLSDSILNIEEGKFWYFFLLEVSVTGATGDEVQADYDRGILQVLPNLPMSEC